MSNILITGTAGFIGFHLAKFLLNDGFNVYGYDGFTNYYDINLKYDRHNILKKYPNFFGIEGMLEDNKKLDDLSKEIEPDIIIHLAACVGGLYKNINYKKEMFEDNFLINFNVLKASIPFFLVFSCAHINLLIFCAQRD